MLELIHALRRRVNRARFEAASARVRATAPLKYLPSDSVTVLSMVGHATLDMYLLAIKSFMVQFGDARIEVVDDGTLSGDDLTTLHHHVPGMRIPDDVRARMAKAGEGPAAAAEGVAIAAEALRAIRQSAGDQVAGVYIMPPFSRVELALQVLERL